MAEFVTFQLETTQADIEAEKTVAESDKDMHLERVEPFTRIPRELLSEGRFVEPVKVLGLATVSMLATRIAEHWLEDPEQGVQMDLRQQPPLISRIADVPRGFLAIIKADGDVSIYQTQDEHGKDLEPILGELLG